jgi:L-asparagine oxygenase
MTPDLCRQRLGRVKPLRVLTDGEHDELGKALGAFTTNPYRDYLRFHQEIAEFATAGPVPVSLIDICDAIRADRQAGTVPVHVVRNCPIDPDVPELDEDDPIADKYAKKKTFVGEALLALVAQLTGTPLMAYGSRNHGDFFTDVIAISRYHGMQTGFSDSELVYHNDRTAHWARADYISLLGLRCPEEEVIYTSYADGRRLVERLSSTQQEVLRQPYFVTPFDPYSQDTNARHTVSEPHPILEHSHSFRYVETRTTVVEDAPLSAKDALIAMKNALILVEKVRHRILVGDLLTFPNQEGLHSRDRIDISDPARARTRWLLKTYAFKDQAAAARFGKRWLDGVPGRVAD